MTPVRRLRVVAAVEAVTVVILLVNLATVHLPVVASVLGPVHGTAYLTGIALTWSGGLPRAARLLACIPAVGAWLAVRTLPHPAPPRPAPPHPAPPHPAPPRPGPHSPSDRARERP